MSRKSLPGGRNAPECHVLFVSGGGVKPFVRRRSDLELGFIDASAAEAIESVRRLPRLAVVWVDESAGPEGVPLVAAIKTFEPDLPIVWSGRNAVGPNFSRPAPDRLVLGPSASQGGTEHVAELVNTTTYHARLVDDLCRASCGALTEGFDTPATAPDTFFKATRSTLASVNAAVEFGGGGMDASVIVSAEARPLREMLRVAVPGAVASLAALHDLAGEIANHIVGRLKLALDPDGVVFDRQVPLVLRGNEANIRSIRGRPSLVARLVAPEVELFVQFYLKGTLPPRRGSSQPAGSQRGQLKFLGDD